MASKLDIGSTADRYKYFQMLVDRAAKQGPAPADNGPWQSQEAPEPDDTGPQPTTYARDFVRDPDGTLRMLQTPARRK